MTPQNDLFNDFIVKKNIRHCVFNESIMKKEAINFSSLVKFACRVFNVFIFQQGGIISIHYKPKLITGINNIIDVNEKECRS